MSLKLSSVTNAFGASSVNQDSEKVALDDSLVNILLDDGMSTR
jgi:hypothetical protein